MRAIPKRYGADAAVLKPEVMLHAENEVEQQQRRRTQASPIPVLADIPSEYMKDVSDDTSDLKVGSTVDNGNQVISTSTKVKFSNAPVVVHNTESHNTINEVLWFSSEEYMIMKMRDRLIVELAKQGKFEESDEHTMFGLESKLNRGHENAEFSRKAVLVEQERQKMNGKPDTELIEVTYTMLSFTAWKEARIRAKENALQVVTRTKPIEPSSILPLPTNRSSANTSISTTTTTTDVQNDRIRLERKVSEKTFSSPMKTLRYMWSPRKKMMANNDKRLSPAAIPSKLVEVTGNIQKGEQLVESIRQ